MSYTKAGLIAGVTLLAGLGGVGFVAYTYGKHEVREACLGDWLHTNLDKAATIKDAIMPAFLKARLNVMPVEEKLERQAEAAAYARIQYSKQSGVSLCENPNWRAKIRAGLKHWSGGKEPKRAEIAYQVADRAMRGEYKYPLPDEWKGINQVQLTRMKCKPSGTYVGSIANASYYRDNGTSDPKRRYEFWKCSQK